MLSLLGHRQRETTAIYAHLDHRALHESAAKAVTVITGAIGYNATPPALPQETAHTGNGADAPALYHSGDARRPTSPTVPSGSIYVDIPFGAVGLYWLEQCLPWCCTTACANIEKMPVRGIACPGPADRQLFESGYSRIRATGQPIVLSRQNLVQFGRFWIPAPSWQALGEYASRLEPAIDREWRQLTANRDRTANRHSASKWGAAASDNSIADRDDAAEGGPATDDAFEWTESRYDTRVALERAKQLREGGFALRCMWSASQIRSSPHIEQCFPWARWRNNDLCTISSVNEMPWNGTEGRHLRHSQSRHRLISCSLWNVLKQSLYASVDLIEPKPHQQPSNNDGTGTPPKNYVLVSFGGQPLDAQP